MAGMDGLLDILEYADDRLDYLIVHNPAKHRGDLPRQVGAAAGAAGSARFARAAKKLIKAW